MEFEELIDNLLPATELDESIAVEGNNMDASRLFFKYNRAVTKASKDAVKAYKKCDYSKAAQCCDDIMQNINDFQKELTTLPEDSVIEQIIGTTILATTAICQNIVYIAAIIGVSTIGKSVGKSLQKKSVTFTGSQSMYDDYSQNENPIVDPKYYKDHPNRRKVGKMLEDGSGVAATLTFLIAKLVKYLKSPMSVDMDVIRKDHQTKNLWVNRLNDIMITAYKSAELMKIKCISESRGDNRQANESYSDDDDVYLPTLEVFEYSVGDFISMGFTKEESIFICAEAIYEFGQIMELPEDAEIMKVAWDTFKVSGNLPSLEANLLSSLVSGRWNYINMDLLVPPHGEAPTNIAYMISNDRARDVMFKFKISELTGLNKVESKFNSIIVINYLELIDIHINMKKEVYAKLVESIKNNTPGDVLNGILDDIEKQISSSGVQYATNVKTILRLIGIALVMTNNTMPQPNSIDEARNMAYTMTYFNAIERVASHNPNSMFLIWSSELKRHLEFLCYKPLIIENYSLFSYVKDILSDGIVAANRVKLANKSYKDFYKDYANNPRNRRFIDSKKLRKMTLYHISTNPDLHYLEPRIPTSRLKTENAATKRICFASSIDGCLRAIPSSARKGEFYVYTPIIEDDTIGFLPSKVQVSDIKYTNEVWILSNIKVKKIRTITLTGPSTNVPVPSPSDKPNITQDGSAVASEALLTDFIDEINEINQYL